MFSSKNALKNGDAYINLNLDDEKTVSVPAVKLKGEKRGRDADDTKKEFNSPLRDVLAGIAERAGVIVPAIKRARISADKKRDVITIDDERVPVQSVPTQQIPVQQVPVQQPPAQQVPVQQVPVQQVPVQQPPVQQSPVQQVPVQQIPAQQFAPAPLLATVAVPMNTVFVALCTLLIKQDARLAPHSLLYSRAQVPIQQQYEALQNLANFFKVDDQLKAALALSRFGLLANLTPQPQLLQLQQGTPLVSANVDSEVKPLAIEAPRATR